MSRAIELEPELARLGAPSLVAWLVTNAENLVVVATTLDERAANLAPSVPRDRVVELCQAIRHASLELTVALLALLSRSDGKSTSAELADAVANAHVRTQELDSATARVRNGQTTRGVSDADRYALVARIAPTESEGAP